MILAALELEDFKQFAGLHEFTPFPDGIIGVIGSNGVGKTTLFEAIEWCLYQPREISNDEVWPRGRTAKPRVRVVLHDTEADVRYVVERTLKRSGANAEVYREDAPETRIVHGSRQVSEYVARHLIGLSHRAFVSTFFTRQKELSFFGTLKETDRRRAVGRLLGLETIRDAQELISEEKTKAATEARLLRAQHEEQSRDRDFAAEAQAAAGEVATQEAAVNQSEERLTAATVALQNARMRLSALRDLERQDAACRQEIERISGDERAAAARQDAAGKALVALDQAARQRADLAPVAAVEAERRGAVTAHLAERDRFTAQQQQQQSLTRAEEDLAKAARQLHRTVTSVETPAVPEWRSRPDDTVDAVAAARRLRRVAEGVDAPGASAHAAALKFCFDLVRLRDQAASTLQKYERALADLKLQRARLVEGGDPREEIAAAQSARESALQVSTQAASTKDTAQKRQQELLPIVKGLETRRFDGACPTCGRPFQEHEIGITLAALNDRLESLSKEIAGADARRQKADRAAKEQEKARQAAEARLAKVANLDGRISQGEPMVAEARHALDKAIRDCADALTDHGISEEPAANAVETAQEQARTLNQIAATIPLLGQLEAQADQAVRDITAARAALDELGPVHYDAEAHQAAERALDEARAAAAQIVQIDTMLANRPAHEADLAGATADLVRLAAERAAQERQRTEIGFDPTALDTEVAAEQQALAAERSARDARNQATQEHREAVSARDRLLAEHERIKGLIQKADARQHEADRFDQMYREFTLFDQYAAKTITPQLANHTGEMLEQITEGKYWHVDFDDNYGIYVFDGDEEKFPVEQFSGGERDVIALCARLALSRLVGSQAVRPPGFLVLDEVFGSLDRDRRQQVLETLGALAGTAEAFQQLFIISHVDDVRFSPVFSEIWRISEAADGVSHLENLAVSGGLEEI